MQKTFKRFLSVALTLAMVFAMIPHMDHTTVTASCEHNWVDSVCTLCQEECAHETWYDATCKAPKTCKTCGKTEGVALDHTLDENKLCAGCETTFLAYLDFEDVTFEEGSTTTLTDGSIITGVGDDVRFAEVEDGVLHLTNNSAAAKVGWYYPVGTGLTSITLSYNVAIIASSTTIMDAPVFSTATYPSQVRFGARLSNNFTWKSKDNTAYENVTAGEGDNLTTFPYGSRWHTVKLVYSVDSTAESGYGYTLSVYLDGVLTNCKQINANATTLNNITTQIERNGQMYIDNVRATAGDVDHVAAVPTVCLCETPSWVDGVCSVCQAHCAHKWENATCFEPRHCQLCNMEVGDPLDHDFVDGKCNLCGNECDHSAGWTEDFVCKGCDYPCPHTDRNAANCTLGEHCAVCRKTFGEKGTDHVLGEDNVCDYCGTTVLADLDFEGVSPEFGTSSGTVEGESYVKAEGGVLHIAADTKASNNIQWSYSLGRNNLSNIVLSYNFAATNGGSASIMRFPVYSFQSTVSPAAFGVHATNNIFWAENGNGNVQVTTGEGDSLKSYSISNTPVWHNVKIVYYTDSSAQGYTLEVYLDGDQVNVTKHSNPNALSNISHIVAQINKNYTGHIYIDNLYATTGEVGHVHAEAVPTVCLCAESQWGDDGICDVCQAHCEHDWKAADCDEAKTCNNCGKVEDAALGHNYNENGVCQREDCGYECPHETFENGACDACPYGCPHAQEHITEANCYTPKTCNKCKMTWGNVIHDWAPADCDDPKTCNICKTPEGEPNGHTWVDGECSVCHIPCTHEKFDANHECKVCGHKCPHTNWTPANCTNPKTCVACGKEESEPSNNHPELGDGKTCDLCGLTFLAYLDFEGVSPELGTSSGTVEGESYVKAEGGVLHIVADSKASNNIQWSYPLSSTVDSIKLSYNFALTSTGTPIIKLPAFSSVSWISNVQFGAQLSTSALKWNEAGTWQDITVDNGTTTFPISSTTPSWHTVEMVYSKTSSSEYTLKVYLDGKETNCTKVATGVPSAAYIAAQLNKNYTGHIYIDNVRATAGGVDHVAATPTVCLCGENSNWVDGVCQNCQAHCEHNWVDADCDEPKHCTRCNLIDGNPLGHDLVNGFCTVCKEKCNHPNWDDNHVCKDCGLTCEHSWTPATCEAPKTCAKCHATEGLKGDHNVVDNKCTVCDAEFLAYLDFENPTGNVGNLSTKESDERYAIVEGGMLHLAAGQTGAAGVNWNYPITSSNSVTLTYNVATTGSALIANFPVFSSVTFPSPVQFGPRQGTIQWNSGSWAPVTVGESETEISWDFSTPRWHTVKMVYTYDSSTSSYTVKLYVDDQLTNCTQIATTNPFRAVTYITAQINAAYAGHIYIDNVRATVGEDTHLPAVPTAPLCPENSCVVGNDGVCSVCHAVIANYTHAIPGVNVALGDTLDMNFFIDLPTDLDVGNTYYAKIVHTYADGTEPNIVKIPQSEWGVHPTYTKYYCVTYGVAAKEMGDTLTVTIHGSEGNVVSREYTDTIKDYIRRMQQNNAHNEYLVTLGDDLLVYGAAAQKGFGYNTENLVSEVRPSMPAVKDISGENSKEFWAGTSLQLESNILLKVFYKAETIQEGYQYRVTYTDHNGKPKTLTGTDFGQNDGNTNLVFVPVKGLSIADYQTVVTVEILDAEEKTLDTIVDSVESFIARSIKNIGKYDVYKAIIQVGKSAHDYFHTKIETGYEDVAKWAW